MAIGKNVKFYLYAAKRSGPYKGKRLLVINYTYEGDQNHTLKDLVDFLSEKKVDLSVVELPSCFATFTKVQ